MSEAKASITPAAAAAAAKEGGMNSNNMNMTPPRHSYANLNTPIASIKRPRSSLNGATPGGGGGRASTGGAAVAAGPGGAVNNNNNMDAMLTSPAAASRYATTPMNGGSNHSQASASSSASLLFPEDVALTPMHPPKPRVHVPHNCHGTGAAAKSMTAAAATDDSVEGKVNALFSPVLNFLASHVPSNRSGGDNDADGAIATDEDGKPTTVDMMMDKDDMTQPTASETSSSKSVSPSNQTVEEEEHVVEQDDEDDDDEQMQQAAQDHSSNNEETLSCCDSLQPIEEDHCEDDEFNPWQFIKSLPDYEEVSRFCPMEYTLAPKSPDAPRLTLVLDLDETLVHCTVDPVPDADLQFPVQFHGTTYQVHVRLRPCLQLFLEKVYQQYEVVVFTASQKVYANELLNLIDPDGRYIRHRLFRESCLAVEGNFLKDLNVLGRDLDKTILVDNSPHAFGYQVDNGIPIESWFDEPNDKELLKLAKFLLDPALKNATDVRPIIRNKFQCYKLIEKATPLY